MAKTNKKPLARSFAGIPRKLMEHDDYTRLSGNAVKLLMALCYQYRGQNNGDLTAAWSVMHERFGFRSEDTLNRAKKELLEANLIMQTRTGRFMNPGGVCALYALTWQPIDECTGRQLEINPTRLAPRDLKEDENK